MKLFHGKASLRLYCLVLSLYTVVAFHLPFFTYITKNVDGGLNGVLITVGAFLLLFALDFLLYALLLFAFRFVGKCIISFTMLGDALTLYFINNFDALITDEMMGNVFNTQYSEASSFLSWAMLLYVVLLGVLPSIYVFARKVDYGRFKSFLAGAGVSLAVTLAVVFGNMTNWPWIDRNAPVIGSLLMPWSYVVNSFRYFAAEKKKNVKEIPLPDVESVREGRDICVLIIGESARRDHYSYYGYPRETNPYTKDDGMTALVANAAATYTTAAVKAILEPFPSGELYEILPNYLKRAGAGVIWRTSNWGEPPVYPDLYYTVSALKERFPEADERYDGILLEGLKDDILSLSQDKIFVVLHTYTNHGPSYFTNYPPQFERYTPVCSTVEMSKATHDELMNAYDNSMIYTDYLIHSVIEILKELPRNGCVIFLSDHGESLGENNLYMHGVPLAMAPKEQIEIPFLVWTSDPSWKVKPLEEVGSYHVFHSVLRFFGVSSPVFDESMSVFEP